MRGSVRVVVYWHCIITVDPGENNELIPHFPLELNTGTRPKEPRIQSHWIPFIAGRAWCMDLPRSPNSPFYLQRTWPQLFLTSATTVYATNPLALLQVGQRRRNKLCWTVLQRSDPPSSHVRWLILSTVGVPSKCRSARFELRYSQATHFLLFSFLPPFLRPEFGGKGGRVEGL